MPTLDHPEAPRRQNHGRRRRLAIAALAAQTFVACGTSRASGSAAHLVERMRPAMGSEVRLTAWTSDDSGAVAAFEEVFREFDRLEDLMSVWRSGSDVVRLNAAAGVMPVPVSADVRTALAIAHEISEWTDGRFDVTFGALSDVWKFDYQDKDNTIPDAAEIARRVALINYRDVVIDDAAGTAFLKRAGMRVNLGGIGKGYAVDRATAILRRRGFNDFIVQAGGDMFVGGTHGGRPWRLGIRDPRGPADRSFATLDLSNGTFSTSGDYERFFIKDGRRYSHIIDPTTGQPARLCRSVTMVTNRAVIADALAKGVFILGPKAGMALIERLPDVEGVIVSARNEVLVSSGLKGKVTVVAPPTGGL